MVIDGCQPKVLIGFNVSKNEKGKGRVKAKESSTGIKMRYIYNN